MEIVSLVELAYRTCHIMVGLVLLTVFGLVEHIVKLIEMLSHEELCRITLHDQWIEPFFDSHFVIGMRHIILQRKNSGMRARELGNNITING